ncbi:Hypothetical protein AA314_07991 [Archangium gephyra]|uniref:Uncharacterized protein n=1 Tax=Archangium gephyra TaxID=48 RepID=A0AAC8QFV0_9BACT|nr:Hypothetical protein AA314_07991 [Archangium gephyra]
MALRSMSWRRGAPGPSRCDCPMNSSGVRGRMRSARGAKRFTSTEAANRSGPAGIGRRHPTISRRRR